MAFAAGTVIVKNMFGNYFFNDGGGGGGRGGRGTGGAVLWSMETRLRVSFSFFPPPRIFSLKKKKHI